MRRTAAVAIACGLVAFGVSGAGVLEAAAARGGSVSSLVGIAAWEPLAPSAQAHDAAFTFAAAHLDGAYFYAIAVDPLALGEEHDQVDVPAYRFGHPGYGWLAWLVAAGRGSAVPLALLWIGLISMFVAGAAASYLAAELGWSPWGGLFVALNPGLLFATMALNSEPLAVAVLILTLLAWMRRRLLWAGVGLVALCLIKEQFVLVPVGLFFWELIRQHRDAASGDAVTTGDEDREFSWLQRVALLAAGPAALGAWFVYLKSVYGVFPFQQKPLLLNPLTIPPLGYLETLRNAAGLHAGPDTSQLGGTALPLLLVVGAALILGLARGWRFTSPVDPVFILLTILLFSLTWVQLLYPKDLMRIAAVQIAILPAVIAGARRSPKVTRDQAVMRT